LWWEENSLRLSDQTLSRTRGVATDLNRGLAITLATLILPTATTFAIGRQPSLGSIVSLTYILAVAAAGWLVGPVAAILVACASVPLLTMIVSGGTMVLPPHIDPVGIAVLILIGLMSSGFARARRRADEVLRKSNLELEGKVRERTAELERARSWLQITLSSIGDAIIAMDREGRVTFLNPMAEELTGWLDADAAGKPVSEVFMIFNEETRDPITDPVAIVRGAGEMKKLENHAILLGSDGREYFIDHNGATIRDAEGEPAGVVLIFRDITQRRTAERLAERARLHLLQTNHELQQFAYAASHDLRQPLRNVSIYAQLLSREYLGKLDAKADRLISVVIAGTKRMEMLLDDLLAYTEASAGESKSLQFTDADMALKRVLASLGVSIDECRAHIDSSPLPEIPMDGVHLEQLFQNLISNSIKYRAERPLVIRVDATRTADEWTFCVADNGIGIEHQYLKKIFGLFKRLHTAEEYEGTGIGLALCQKIVQRYGGRIWVESEPDCGSRFYFTVPARIQDTAG
jgi:PAS domain S-box-containing protein